LAAGCFILGILTCFALAGCAKQQQQAAAKGPPEVMVSLPVSQQITDYEEFAGRLESCVTIQIRARVTGYLLAAPTPTGRYFKEGGYVKKGDLLFEIDPQLYEAALARDEGALRKWEGELKRAKADWNRALTLNDGTLSKEDISKYEGAYLVAEGEVKTAKANLKMSQVNMGYTKIQAPISGKISKATIDPGNLVKADDTILTSIGASDPIKAYFDVDERTVQRIQGLIRDGVIPADVTGTKVWMGLADDDNRPYEGTVDFLDNYVDSGTGTLRVRGAFANPNDYFVPGMFVRVRVPIGNPQQATLIAEKALVTDQGQKFVYVVTDENESTHEGQVKYRQVKLGRLHKGLRVIKEGLKPNEKVVVSGLQRVRPDIKVKFTSVDMPNPLRGKSEIRISKSEGNPQTNPKSESRNPKEIPKKNSKIQK
jgi:multidrug efflux system membrane fusion protein